jgi:hypothetical protein
MTNANTFRWLAVLGVAGSVALPCWAKDVAISREGGGRALIAVHPREPDRLGISGLASQCESTIAVHVSTDRGTSWTPRCMPDNGYSMYERPSVAFHPNGTLLATHTGEDELGSALFLWRSPDDGLTWKKSFVDSPYSSHGSVSDAHVHVDDRPDSPHRGSIYLSYRWTDVSDGDQTRVAYSRNGGRDWTLQGATSFDDRNNMGPASLAIGRDGKLYLAYSKCTLWLPDEGCIGSATVRMVRSDDGGVTWSAPTIVADKGLPPDSEGMTLPNTNVRAAMDPSLAVDASSGPRKGELYAALTALIDGRLQVVITRSEDGGTTWSPQQPVSAAPGDQFMPTVGISRRGEMAVTWLDRRNDAAAVRYQPMIAFSTDGGRSFGEPTPLDKDLTDPALHPRSYMDASITHVWDGRSVQSAFQAVGQQEQLTLRVTQSKP